MIAGPREISDALKALRLMDFHNKAKSYWTLRCLFVSHGSENVVVVAKAKDELIDEIVALERAVILRRDLSLQRDGH